MRITIYTEDGQEKEFGPQSGQTMNQPEQSGSGQPDVSPPAELAARAAVMGASSAGPAPAEMAAAGPTSFVSTAESPETAPADRRGEADMSGGGAPTFAAGEIQSEGSEADPDKDETDEDES